MKLTDMMESIVAQTVVGFLVTIAGAFLMWQDLSMTSFFGILGVIWGSNIGQSVVRTMAKEQDNE